MKLGKVMALVLLMAVVSPMVMAYGLSQAAQPASCHEHGPKAPAPSPVTYQCCRAAHQFAAVRELVNLRFPLLKLFSMIEFAVTPLTEHACQTRSEPPAFGSSGGTSLRI